jgi:V/A-type H+-transporting ATPase subunit E
MKNQENLEGIVSKLKEQGIKAGETEKNRLIEAANEKAEKMLAEAEAHAKKLVAKAEAEAAQIEKNSNAAISQAARDMVEATKIAITKHLKEVFGTQCENIITQDEYLKELLKLVLVKIEGNKTVEVPATQLKKMQTFIAGTALKNGVEVKPLSKSEAKISITCNDNEGIQYVITSKDIEDGLFSLLNHDLLELINNNRES